MWDDGALRGSSHNPPNGWLERAAAQQAILITFAQKSE